MEMHIRKEAVQKYERALALFLLDEEPLEMTPDDLLAKLSSKLPGTTGLETLPELYNMSQASSLGPTKRFMYLGPTDDALAVEATIAIAKTKVPQASLEALDARAKAGLAVLASFYSAQTSTSNQGEAGS